MTCITRSAVMKLRRHWSPSQGVVWLWSVIDEWVARPDDQT